MIKDLLKRLDQEMELQRSQEKVKEDHKKERRENQASSNRKAWVYGLQDSDAMRYIGVSFYPEYHVNQVLRVRTDSLGEWIRKNKPEVIWLEEVGYEEMSKKVNLWQRKFKGGLIKRTRKVKQKPIEDMNQQELRESLMRQVGGL